MYLGVCCYIIVLIIVIEKYTVPSIHTTLGQCLCVLPCFCSYVIFLQPLSNDSAATGFIVLNTSVVVMVVVNCNYAVMDYLLYLIVSNFG